MFLTKHKFSFQIEEKDRDYKITSRTSRNSRRSLLSCGDCRLFKTTSRFTLKRHVKRAHPFSLSALPPLSKKRKGNGHHLKNSGIKVARKAHQVYNIPDNLPNLNDNKPIIYRLK